MRSRPSHGFRSQLERKVDAFIQAHKIEASYESKRLPYTLLHTYTPDWQLPSGAFVEAKGAWEPSDRTKIKAILDQHKGIDLRMVFSAPHQPIRPGSTTTYADVCDSLGIRWTGLLTLTPDFFT
jgi:hypothetical protein